MGETPIYKWPLPDGPDTPNVPRDMKALGEAIESSLNGVLLGGATQPMSFVGKGRPDVDTGVHSADELAQLAAAPTGSVYTCVDPNDAAGKNLGAAVWRKGDDWVCVEGETPMYAWEGVGVRRYSESIYFGMQQTSSKFQNWSVTMPDSRWRPTVTCNVGLYQTSYHFNCGHVAINKTGQIVARYALPAGAGGQNAAQFYAVGICVQPWPTAPPPGATPAMSLAELRELIETEADPEKLQQLKDELGALERDNA